MTIGFLYDRFLPLSETFLLHEWRALQSAGLPLKTYALARVPADQACATAAELDSVTVLSLNAAALAAKTAFYLRHPLRGSRLAVAMLGAAASARPSGAAHLWRSNRVFSLLGRLAVDQVTHLHATFLGLPATLAWCAHQLTGIPFSISAHARDVWAEDFASAEKIAAAHRIFVCNRAAADHLRMRFPDHAAKVVVAPHGLPQDDPPPPPAPGAPATVEPPPQAWRHGARHKLLAIGRLVEKKGFDYLLTACDVLRQHELDFGLAIVGAGPDLQRLGGRIQELGLTDRVDLMGAQPPTRVRQLMSQADLLVVPSIIAADEDRDGVPNVILEAFLAGLPVVASPAGGIPEVVLPEKTGFLALDYFPAGLIHALRTALETPLPQRQALAINAKFWLQENRDLTICIDPLLTYFQSR